MKKVISLLLVCMLMLSMVQVVNASDTFTGSIFTVPEMVGEAKNDITVEDTVCVPVYIDKVPSTPTGLGYYLVSIYFTYDKTKLAWDGDTFDADGYCIEGIVYNNKNERSTDLEYGSASAETDNGDGTGSRNIQAVTDTNMVKLINSSSVTGKTEIARLYFKRLANCTGNAEVEVTKVVLTGATYEGGSVTSSDLDYSTDVNMSRIDAGSCTVKFSDVYSATIGEYDTDKGEVSIAIAGDKNPEELDTGDVVTITATPEDGYEVDKIFVNGSEIVGNTYTIDDVSAVITATFKAKTYNITYPSTEAVTAWTPATAEYGSTVVVTPTYTSGKYTLTGVTANDGAVEITANDDKTFTFTMPASDVEIKVEGFEFAADNFNVNKPSNEAYTITGLDTSYAERTEVTFTVAENEGYTVNSVTATGVELTDNGSGSYSFTMPANDITINVVAAAIERDVTSDEYINASALTGVGHTVDFASYQTTASVGEKVKFKITPAENKSITGVTATFTNGSEECTLESSILFEVGGVYSFTMPADGKVTLTASEVSADVSLAEINVISDATDPISVTGAEAYSHNLDEYYDGTVTVSATTNGGGSVVVDPADPVTIAGGTTKTYTITVYAADYDYDHINDDGSTGFGTKAVYTVNVKNPFAAGAANLIIEGAEATTKGGKYTATVKAIGIPAGSTWVDFKIQLPVGIVALDDVPVNFELGAGVTAANPTTEIVYNSEDGTVEAKILNGTESFSSDEIELLTMSFDVVEETSEETFDITGLSAKYSQDTEDDAVSFVSYGSLEDVEIAESNATIADAKKAEVNSLYDEEDYTEQDWFTVEDAIEAAIDAIDAAIDEAAMDAAIDALKLTVEGGTDPETSLIVAPIETLAAYKDTLKTAIQEEATRLIGLEAYFEAEEAEIQAIADKYITETTGLIDNNTSRDEELLAMLVDDAIAEMLAVETMAAIKGDALAEIVVNNLLYVDEAQDAITTAINTATTAINTAQSEEAVNNAVTAFNNAIAALEDQKIVTERNTSIGEVADGKTIDGTNYDGVNDLNKSNYTASNWNEILIEQLKATIAINSTTSSEAMDDAVEEALKNIDAVLTIAEEENAALAEINAAEDAADLDIDLIKATGVDNVDTAKEALYEAAILEYLEANPSGYADVEALQTDINRVNGLTIGLRGDFNESGTVDGSDAAGAMKYLCGVALGWTPTAQGIVNADLCTPGDGVLTVYDVVQIIKEINL